MNKTYTVLSLGAGVQSSTLALMAAKGVVTPMPDVAIFADTGDEPKNVYDWLEWLTAQLPYEVVTVRHESGIPLSEATQVLTTSKKGRIYTQYALPAHLLSAEGKRGMAQRACTGDFKIAPIHRYVRAKLKEMKIKQAEMWIGISRDEIMRMKDSRVQYLKHRFPLIDAWVTRDQCITWMRDNGYPDPPRSACVFCPYHNNAEWRRLRDQDPEAFARAVEFEKQYQQALARTEMRDTPYLHPARIPLAEVDFDSAPDKEPSLFDNDCEGMCGN